MYIFSWAGLVEVSWQICVPNFPCCMLFVREYVVRNYERNIVKRDPKQAIREQRGSWYIQTHGEKREP